MRINNLNQTQAVVYQLGGMQNSGLALFGGSVLCNSSDTWNIRITRCGNIDGDCQMADNSIHYPGGNIAHIWRLIPSVSFAACNLGLRNLRN